MCAAFLLTDRNFLRHVLKYLIPNFDVHKNTKCQTEYKCQTETNSTQFVPAHFRVLGLPSNWRQAIMLQLCSSSFPNICPLKVLRIRFFCPQFSSICVSNTLYSLKTPGIKFLSLLWLRSWNSIPLNQQKHFGIRHDPSTWTFLPTCGYRWSDQWGWTSRTKLYALSCPSPQATLQQ